MFLGEISPTLISLFKKRESVQKNVTFLLRYKSSKNLMKKYPQSYIPDDMNREPNSILSDSMNPNIFSN